MDEAFEHKGVPLSGLRGDAAAILARTPLGNLHAGLAFVRGGGVEFVHLAWEDRLANDWPWGGVWACPMVEPERLESVAGMCRLVWKEYEKSRKFPYALRFGKSSFDQYGRLILGQDARGLTCATFILAVLNSVGIALVEEDSWPIRKNDDEIFLEFLSQHATAQHLALLRREVEAGVKRIRPEEVIGACVAGPPPVAFEHAREAAAGVLVSLDGA